MAPLAESKSVHKLLPFACKPCNAAYKSITVTTARVSVTITFQQFMTVYELAYEEMQCYQKIELYFIQFIISINKVTYLKL